MISIQRAMPDVRVRHVLSAVADKIGKELKPLSDKKIAYHDPCLLGGALGIYEMPRELITKLGGELIRLPREREDAPCCGAGGAVPEVDPDLALRIARGRIEEVLAAGVQTLLTSCDECADQMRKAVRVEESLQVLTITEVMLQSV
jgi:glycolate oxidase